MDLFSVPILVIFATDLVKRIKISKLIIKIGQKSTNMWLIHTFFCYYYYPVAQLIYKPQYAILIWLLLMVLTYIASVLVDILYVKAGYIIKKILPKNKI